MVNDTVSTKGALDFEEGWRYMEEKGFKPLIACLDANEDSRTLFTPEELIQFSYKVYTLCVPLSGSWAPHLYDRIQRTLCQHLEEKTLKAVKDVHGEFLLKELVRRWNDHKVLVRWVTFRFRYLDRYYVHNSDGKKYLESVGFTCFQNVVFSHISVDVRHALLELVQKERNGEQIDTSLLMAIKDIFVEMGMGKLTVYESELETPFLEATHEYYYRESARWAEEYSFHDFMEQAGKSIEAELHRTRAYLHPKTESLVRQCTEEEILERHQERMLEKENSGLVVMLEQNQTEYLKKMFRLYCYIDDGLVPIAEIFKDHIEKKGMQLIEAQRNKFLAKEAERDAGGSDLLPSESAKQDSSNFECIESLLKLHDRYMNLVVECFESHLIFLKAMKDAFEVFVNQQFGRSSTAVLFANYSDSLLSQSGMGSRMMEDDIENTLDKLVMLFAHLSEKDKFQEFAQKQLAKRLLFEKSLGEGVERSFIQKLKYKCGSHYTAKLEGMITDINLSIDHRSKFREWYKKKMTSGKPQDDASNSVNIKDISFSVHVLASGHWPSYQEDVLDLAAPLKECINTFSEYYHEGTSQRVLKWVHSLGKGSLETTAFEGNKKIRRVELSASAHQMCILLLFNDADELTFEKIRETLQVADAKTMAKNMDSLCEKKYPLLLKTEDVYKLNTSWASPKRLIKVPIPTAKITVEEIKAAHKAVEEDRKLAIESAIMRVMKNHHELPHSQLVVEVTKQLMRFFRPEPRPIKDRIEELIIREYLERDQDDPSLYRYLA